MAQNKNKNLNPKPQFLMMTAERAKHDYKAKLITAEAYILYLLEIHRTEGWKWTFEPKQFCKEWEIPKSTFYRTISSLKCKGLVNWEVEGKVSLWRGSDIAMPDEALIDETEDSLTNETTVSRMGIKAVPPSGQSVSPLGKSVSPMRLKTARTLTEQTSQNPTDIKDILTNKEERLKAKQEQEGISPNTQDGLLSKEDLLKHLKWAEQGTKPTEVVIAQIREDGRYWPAFVQYARLHEWDMRNQESCTSQVKEVIEQVKAKLKKA